MKVRSPSLVLKRETPISPHPMCRFIQTQLGLQPEPPDNEKPADINEHTLLIKEVLVEGGKALKLTPIDWEDLDGTSADYAYFKSGNIPMSIGDTNFDGDIDGLDLQAFAISYGSSIFEADLDGDGQINKGDMKIFAARFGQAIELN